MRTMTAMVVVAASTVLGLAGVTAAAESPSPAVAALPNGAPDIDTAAVKAHLTALQNIATNQGNGNRCTGSGGYTGSVNYVKQKAEAAGYTVTEQPFSTFGGQRSSNVLAELPGQDTSKVIMAGGHLDSVCAGPGINDNGSGSAAVLAVAEAFARANPHPKVTVRFGWWGHEEAGLVGSQYYVDNLSGSERTRVQAYLNVDMIGSPNPGYFVYNDDDDAIEQTINAYFAEIGWPTEGQSVGGRSDSASFQRAGVRTGGIFTGAEQRKTQAQVDKWGGQAGVAYDRCYHASCDTTSNIDDDALGRNSDAISWTVWELTGGGGTPPDSPVASFTADCSTAEPSCAFDASASTDPDGTISSYSWKFGDGQTGTGATPSHTYDTAGDYTVELTVTDNDGNTDTDTTQVTAGRPPQTGEPPRASFTVFCQWATCDFDGTATTDADNDITTYAWNFGDGQTGTGATTSHSYPNRQANYTATLTVTDRGGNTNTVTKQIQCWSFGTQAFCFNQ